MINKQKDSDSKRLASLKKIKEAFKAKERLIQEALKSTDSSNLKKNKIIFSDDIDQVESVEIKNDIKEKEDNATATKNKCLFDDDNDANDDEDDFDFSDSNKTKTRIIGNDSRFTLDKRFIEEKDEENDESNEKSNNVQVADDLEEEKKKQLEILENVLGKPILKKDEREQSTQKKKKMVRYDPTEVNHSQHEIEMDETKAPPKKKKKKNVEELKKKEESAPLAPVSNEIFFSVSDALTENLKQHEEFSLLKKFKPDDNDSSPQNKESENKSSQELSNFSFNFDVNNPFKYDSSDNEGDEQEKNKQLDEKKSYESSIIERNKTFFFIEDDPRFKEAQQFIKMNFIQPEAFKNVRSELKQIVRKKKRNNLRKNVQKTIGKKMNIKNKKKQ